MILYHPHLMALLNSYFLDPHCSDDDLEVSTDNQRWKLGFVFLGQIGWRSDHQRSGSAACLS